MASKTPLAIENKLRLNTRNLSNESDGGNYGRVSVMHDSKDRVAEGKAKSTVGHESTFGPKRSHVILRGQGGINDDLKVGRITQSYALYQRK